MPPPRSVFERSGDVSLEDTRQCKAQSLSFRLNRSVRGSSEEARRASTFPQAEADTEPAGAGDDQVDTEE